MATLLEDMVTYLIAQGIVTADGTDIWRDSSPDTPDTAVVLYEYAGRGSSIGDVATVRSIQVTARAKRAVDAKAKANAIYKSLIKEKEPIVYLTTTRYTVLKARQTPFKIGVDESNRIIYGFNLAVTTTND